MQAKISQDRPRAIISASKAGASAIVLSALPKYESQLRQINRERQIPSESEINRIDGEIVGDFSLTIRG
jgi:hypothetical protein